jgi:hypothetical protein
MSFPAKTDTQNTTVNRIADAVPEARRTQAGDAPPVANGDNGAPAPNAGRDARGRFARGNPFGSGNPHARQVAALRRAVYSAVTEKDIQAIAHKLLEMAQEGDVAAAKLLLAYTVGQPAPTVDPDKLDLAEWDIVRATPAPIAEFHASIQGVPKDTASELARIVQPCVGARFGDLTKECLLCDDAHFADLISGRVLPRVAQSPAERARSRRKRAKRQQGKTAAPSRNGDNGRPARKR